MPDPSLGDYLIYLVTGVTCVSIPLLIAAAGYTTRESPKQGSTNHEITVQEPESDLERATIDACCTPHTSIYMDNPDNQ
jgi:hypothetical protein